MLPCPGDTVVSRSCVTCSTLVRRDLGGTSWGADGSGAAGEQTDTAAGTCPSLWGAGGSVPTFSVTNLTTRAGAWSWERAGGMCCTGTGA